MVSELAQDDALQCDDNPAQRPNIEDVSCLFVVTAALFCLLLVVETLVTDVELMAAAVTKTTNPVMALQILYGHRR